MITHQGDPELFKARWLETNQYHPSLIPYNTERF